MLCVRVFWLFFFLSCCVSKYHYLLLQVESVVIFAKKTVTALAAFFFMGEQSWWTGNCLWLVNKSLRSHGELWEPFTLWEEFYLMAGTQGDTVHSTMLSDLRSSAKNITDVYQNIKQKYFVKCIFISFLNIYVDNLYSKSPDELPKCNFPVGIHLKNFSFRL